MTPRDLGMHLIHEVERRMWNFKEFGAGSVIAPFPRFVIGARYTSIGKQCFFGAGLTLSVVDEFLGVRHTPVLEVGDGTVTGRDLLIACTFSIKIGYAVAMSDRIFIGDSHHGYENPDVPVLFQPMTGQSAVVIGDGCQLGVGCAIMPGVTLERNCVVAPNSVVTRSFEANTVLLGNPARPIRVYDRAKGAWVP